MSIYWVTIAIVVILFLLGIVWAAVGIHATGRRTRTNRYYIAGAILMVLMIAWIVWAFWLLYFAPKDQAATSCMAVKNVGLTAEYVEQSDGLSKLVYTESKGIPEDGVIACFKTTVSDLKIEYGDR